MPTVFGKSELITDREKILEVEREWNKYEKEKQEYREALKNSICEGFPRNPMPPSPPRGIGKSVEYYYESPSALHETRPFIIGEDLK